jgi:hypothetical protein
MSIGQMPRVYAKADEETKKRLAEMRLKGLETRKMKAELKKVEKEQQKAELKNAYEEKVLKSKKQEPEPVKIEETTKEIYPSATHADETEAEESDEEPVPMKPVKAKKQGQARPPTQPPMTNVTNYKQEYYKLKMMKLQEHDEHNRFMQSYSQMPPSVHVADIARQQLKSKVDKELMQRVYNDLFQC